LLRGVEGGYNNKADIWAFGCIVFELFTGRKAFLNDFETYQYGVQNRSPKKYFKGLDDLEKYYISRLLEVDPYKRPSARELMKEKFFNETPSCDSAETTRAQKQRRILSSTVNTSSLLEASLTWAISNQQPDLITALLETGLNVFNEVQVHNILKAFRLNDDYDPKVRAFIAIHPPSFWRAHIPGFALMSGEETIDTQSDAWHSWPSDSEPSYVLPTTFCIEGDDWYAISNTPSPAIKISLLHTETISFLRNGRLPVVRFSVDGQHLAIGRSGEAPMTWKMNFQHNSEFSLGTIAEMSLKGLINDRYLYAAVIAFGPDCSSLAVANLDGRVRIWNLADKTIKTVLNTPDDIHAIAISQDGSRLITGGPRSTVMWNLRTGQRIAETNTPCNEVEISPCGGFAALNWGTITNVWHLESPHSIQKLAIRDFRVISLHRFAFSHKQPSEIFSLDGDRRIAQWELASLPSTTPVECKSVLGGVDSGVSALALSPDNKWLVSGSCYGSIKFWDPVRGTLAAILNGCNGHGGKLLGQKKSHAIVTNISFHPSPQKKLFASTFGNRKMRIWSYESMYENP
jgi:WD40 repeat protein